MKTKTYPLLRRSNSGDMLCANGEIESARNALLYDYAGSATPPAASTPPAYISPSSGLRPLHVRFALSSAVLQGWHNHPSNPPQATVACGKTGDADGWAAQAAALYTRFASEAKRNGLFVKPFFAMACIRLANGCRILPSPPVLLTPNPGIPSVDGSDNFSLSEMKMTIPLSVCRLRVAVGIPPSTAARAGAGAVLEILLSEPVETAVADEPWLSFHRPTDSTAVQCWRPRPLGRAELTASVLSKCTFLPVAATPLEDCNAAGEWTDVDFNLPFIEDIPANRWKPDYLQLQGMHAAGSSVIAGRTTCWDLTLSLPEPLHPAALRECREDEKDEAVISSFETVKGGRTLLAAACRTDLRGGRMASSSLPPWLFVPDPDAEYIRFTAASRSYIFPLKRHPFLNGSYWWAGALGFAESSEGGITMRPVGYGEVEDILSLPTYRLPSAIWRSERGQPLCFTDRLLMTVDDSVVSAVVRAFRASGLVAASAPTAYLFTDRGLYLLKEAADGSLLDAGLIAGCVLGDAASIVTEGRTLYFTDIDGKRWELSGSTVKPSAEATSEGDSPGEGKVAAGSGKVAVRADGSGKPVGIVLRPMKLEEPEGLWSLRLEGAFSRSGLGLKLYGSTDLRNWHLLCSSPADCLTGIYTPGLRFAKLHIEGALEGELVAVSLIL